MEETGYEFMNYDYYGNEIELFLPEGEYCLASNSEGYLQLIIRRETNRYFLYHVDASGRPLWQAVFDRENGTRYDYMIWNYKELTKAV